MKLLTRLLTALTLLAGLHQAAAQVAFAPAANYPLDWPRCVTAADVNGDGKADLISVQGDGTLTVWTNNGSGGFVFAGTYGVGSMPQAVIAADLNGDGHMDLITANLGGTLSVLINVPTLALKSSASTMQVSWPSCWTNWTLQQNSDLTTTNWSACMGIVSDGTNNCLTIQSPSGNQFFRLSYP